MLRFLEQLTMLKSVYLADDGVVSGSDGVEDPLDAFQLLLIAGGDPVKSLIVVLQRTAALTAGSQSSSPLVFIKINDWGREEQASSTYMSEGSATSMYLIFISLGKSISSFTSQSLLTSTEESLGFSWALKYMDMEKEKGCIEGEKGCIEGEESCIEEEKGCMEGEKSCVEEELYRKKEGCKGKTNVNTHATKSPQQKNYPATRIQR